MTRVRGRAGGAAGGQEKLSQGRSTLLPSVNINANSTFNDVNVTYLGASPFPGGNYRYNSSGVGVTLVQPLFRQQNWVAYTSSELLVVQAEAHSSWLNRI